MPNNPNNARSLLNLVKAPTQATSAPQAAVPTIPTLSAEEARVQKAYQALGISPPIGTPQNPVKMAAGGGVLGDIGLLNAVRMGIKPRLTPEQQAYMDQYNTYTEKYNTEFLPAYEAIAPQREAWEAEYNKVVEDINAGKYDKTFNLRSDSSKGWQEYYAALNAGYENIQYGPDIVRPKTANVIYKTPEPVLTVAEPVMPTVNAEGYAPTEGERYLEDVSLAAQQSAKRRNLGLAAFSNPQGYNLAGFGGAATFKDGGEVDREEGNGGERGQEEVLSKREILDRLIERQALQNLLSEMSAVRVDPSLIAGTFEDKNAKGNYYDVGADISLGDKLGLGASGRGTSVKFDGGGFKENVLSQLRGSYITDDGIQYAAEYSPVGNPGQLDPTQKAFRLSRRNLNDQSEISLSREPGRMGMDIPGQAPEPGTTDTTWLRYAKQFAEGGDVKKSAEPFGKGEPAKKVEGSPYNEDGSPITAQGPSAGDVASFINSFVPGTGDVQSAAEGYQAFKEKDYLGAALGAAGAIPLVPNITKYVKGIPYEGRKSLEKLLRNEDIPFITVPMDKEDMFASMKPYDVKNQLDDLAGTDSRSRIFYHAGDAGIGADTTARNMGGGRDTGHFGTGTYAVTDKEKLPPFYTENRPVIALISRPDENLYLGRTEELDKAHRALRKVNALASSDKLLPKDKILRALNDFDYYFSLRESDPELFEKVKLVSDAQYDLPGRYSSAPEKMIDAANEHIKARLGAGGSFWKERVQRDSASTRYMKGQGYGGVNTGLAPEMDNTTYRSVIYRKGKYKDGGEVSSSKLDPVYVETESLRNQIEAGLPKDKYFETYPVRIVDTMKNARDTEGGVTRPYGEPGVVNINPKGNFKDKYGTFEHERQHLIDAKRGKTELRYPAPEYIPEDAKYNKPTVPVDKELQFKTKNDIYSAFQKYRKELGLAADFVEEGFFAEIRRIEKSLPPGKSILETSIGKDLFANNPELLQTYWSRTRPEFTTYMTEQRDSPRYKMDKRTDVYKEQPKTTEKGTLTKVQDFIRSKTNN